MRFDVLTLFPEMFQGYLGQSILKLALERGRAAPSVRQRRSGIPWSLESILRKCLAPAPGQRYQQAEELAEDLRRFLDGQPIVARPVGAGERLVRSVRRRPRVRGLVPCLHWREPRNQKMVETRSDSL